MKGTCYHYTEPLTKVDRRTNICRYCYEWTCMKEAKRSCKTRGGKSFQNPNVKCTKGLQPARRSHKKRKAKKRPKLRSAKNMRGNAPLRKIDNTSGHLVQDHIPDLHKKADTNGSLPDTYKSFRRNAFLRDYLERTKNMISIPTWKLIVRNLMDRHSNAHLNPGWFYRDVESDELYTPSYDVASDKPIISPKHSNILL